MTAFFFSVVAMLLVVEGVLPFLSPRMWRDLMMRMSEQSDRALRIVGLCSMLIGVIILYIIHH
jgi:uncharacterized protein